MLKKVVTLLSTMHYDKGTESSGETKPEIIQYNNYTKGGVNTMNQMVHYYNTKRFKRRWPMVVFFYLKNKSAINSIISWIKNQVCSICKKGVRHALLVTLAKSLETLRVYYNPLYRRTFSSHSRRASENTNERKRCYLCFSKKDRESKINCTNCQLSICSEHSINICLQCRK